MNGMQTRTAADSTPCSFELVSKDLAAVRMRLRRLALFAVNRNPAILTGSFLSRKRLISPIRRVNRGTNQPVSGLNGLTPGNPIKLESCMSESGAGCG